MIDMSRPFVIQIHSGYGQLHYDFMLGRGAVLATWQLASRPESLAVGEAAAAKRIQDHRAAYLTYEGPVSGGRGQVSILDAGTYESLADREDRWEFRLAGRQILGRFELCRVAPDGPEWTLRRLAD